MTQFLKGSLRKFGLDFIGDVPWGTHFCQLYETKQDLIDILIPYFAEGLRNNEFCMWVTSPPLEMEEAKAALRNAIPDLDEYIRKGQIEILPYTEWYLLGGEFDINRVFQGWVEKEKMALARSFEGLRLSGNTFWIERSMWNGFADYEAAVNNAITSHRMLALCTYSLKECAGTEIVDVLRNHVGALIIKDREWHLVEDMVRREKAEEALMKSEKKERVRAEELRTILDAVPAAVWIANDPESRQIVGNRSSYEFLRLPEGANDSMSAPKGERPINYRVLKDGRELKPEEMPVQLAARGEVLRDFEFSIEFTDGNIRHFLGNACPIYDAEGKPRGSVAAFIDITERKAMQDKLEEYSKHLEKLVEEKTKQLKDAERLAAIGETAGMIGHDIRNPLQAITGELYLSKDCLRSLPESEAKKELADSMRVIEEQTYYIDKIVTDLQDYARPLVPRIEEVDVESIVESVLSTMDISEDIKVAYLIEEGYPKLMIDSSYMKRTLTNLIANAVQAMPNGGTMAINAYCKGNQAFVSVEDTGEGIPEEAKKKIFKPLFTTKAKGQGFGLPVAKKLTEALDGTITFESEKGKGTKFIIQFPRNPNKNNT